jgi:four helix bundle protein
MRLAGIKKTHCIAKNILKRLTVSGTLRGGLSTTSLSNYFMGQEAWKKRIYPKMFVSKVIDAAGEAGETEVWLDISKDAQYLSTEKYKKLSDGYDEVNRMLYGMAEKPEKFCFTKRNA